MKFCKECVYPKVAVLLSMDDDGVCSACKAHKIFLEQSDTLFNHSTSLASFQGALNSTTHKLYPQGD